jgi:hypothetical protein
MSICRKNFTVVWFIFGGSASNLLLLDTPEDGGHNLLWNVGIITNRCEIVSQNTIVFKKLNYTNINSYLIMTRKNILTKVMLQKKEYLSHSHTGYKYFIINYVFILHLSTSTKTDVGHAVISAPACETFVLTYSCHFHHTSKYSREKSKHVACRAPTPSQRSRMWCWDRTVRNPPSNETSFSPYTL